MPSRIVLPVSCHRNLARPFSQRLQRVQRPPHLVFASHDPDQLLHHRLQIVFDLIGALTILTALPIERLESEADDVIRLLRIGPRRCLSARVLGSKLPGAHTEYEQI